MHLELSDVTKAFGKTVALSHLTLNLPPSSLVAVLGENGAGKSTLLRLLGGMAVPDKGSILMDGRPYCRENLDLRRRIYFTPDVPVLFGDATVGSNLATLAELYQRTDFQTREHEVMQWLEDTGTAALIRRKVGLLSRGQIWKVGLAAAALIEPELWLVDEPFASGMDALGMGAFRRLVRVLTERGSTIIYTTQMVEMAAEFADHICVIREGRLVLWETSLKVRERLQNDPNGAENVLRGLSMNPT